ncbi:MFS transporter [Nocardia sp. NPDC088792]|uniref:MFS transporter n=1 Tax=Nocardia sp. NPDC088792 TaxID=3364332 RepID=UPI00382595BC
MQAPGVRRWLALGALAVAMLTIGLDVTVLTVALPTLAVDLHAGTSDLQWFSSAYTLALAAVMLPAGALGDRYGRKKFLLGALLLFGVASAICAFAGSSGELIAARVVLGIAAAVMIPLSMAVLPALFPEPAERQRAITIWITSTAIGMPLGPILGGWLLQHYWWGSVFLINVPLVIVGALAVGALVPESRSEHAFRIDLPGVALSILGMLGITYGFIRIGQKNWGDVTAWATIAIGLVAAVAFVLWQRRNTQPLVDLKLFASSGFRWGTIYSIIVNFAMFGLLFTMPQYFQAVLGTDALGSGLRLLPMIGGLAAGTRLVDKLLAKAGIRTVLTTGFALLAAGLVLGALIGAHTSYGLAAAALVLLGFGMGFVMPSAMGLAMGDLAAERAGSGSALLQALRQASGTIGVAILGTVLATQYRSSLGAANHEPLSDGVNAGVAVARKLGDPALLGHVQSAFTDGMSLMLWVCAAIAAAAAVLAATMTRGGHASDTPDRPADTPVPDAGQSVHVG